MSKLDIGVFVHGEQSKANAHELIDASFKEFGEFTVTMTNKKKYTNAQRRALHLWCNQCALVLNENNIPCIIIHPFTKQEIEMEWTGNLFKENIYKFVLLAMTGKSSTEDQDTVEPDKVALVISKRYADNGLICPPWPSLR